MLHKKTYSLHGLLFLAPVALAVMMAACSEEKEHTAPAVNPRD